MIHSKMQQTEFHIERLGNAVNVGSCSAYQIYTSPGKHLGKIGTIINPTAQLAANEKEFLVKGATENGSASWFRKALASLKS
jgi:hypothetical protein